MSSSSGSGGGSGSTTTTPCDELIRKREKCYQQHSGESIRNMEEKCCVPKLLAKRCVAFQHCELEALQYYGDANCHAAATSNSTNRRAYCGAYEESYCFGNPRTMKIDKHGEDDSGSRKKKQQQKQQTNDAIFNYHLKAKDRVLGNRQRFRECQELSRRLHACLSKTKTNISQHHQQL